MGQHEDVDDMEILRAVRGRLAAIYHDLNNPLSVASGNVQFMSELLRMGDVDGLADALADVESAVSMLEERLKDVLELRRALDSRLAAGGEE